MNVCLCVCLCVSWLPSSEQGALLQPLTASLCLTFPRAASDRMLVCVQTFVQPALDQHSHQAPGCLSAFINNHTFSNRSAAWKWKKGAISQNKQQIAFLQSPLTHCPRQGHVLNNRNKTDFYYHCQNTVLLLPCLSDMCNFFFTSCNLNWGWQLYLGHIHRLLNCIFTYHEHVLIWKRIWSFLVLLSDLQYRVKWVLSAALSDTCHFGGGLSPLCLYL